MEQLFEHPVTPTTPRQQSSSWYHAATLSERITSWPAQDTAHVLSEQGGREAAEKIVQRWKEQRPFNKEAFFADRLAMDDITEEDLLALLAEPLESLQERLGHPAEPVWVATLLRALQANSGPHSLLAEDFETAFQVTPMLEPFYPLLQESIARLQTGIGALSQQYDTLPFDPEAILPFLLPNLFQQIQPQVSKTLVLELNIARLRGNLQGETPQARFQYYLNWLSQREQLQPFLEEYCVLARHVLISSWLWADCCLEFLQRLCGDWSEILSVFAPEQEPGVLITVAGGAGDTHRGGHSVMILTFRSGWRLVYKPKSLTIDVHFQELLAWLNDRGSHPAFRLLKLINKITYGWTEFIPASGCSSEEEVAHFYERQGGYLALLYALEAIDFHFENIIAVGEHPVLIDLEALFHPRIPVKDATTHLAQQAVEHSVLRIALLPWRMLANEESEGVDISGLGRLEGQLSPHPIPLWEEVGTDEMKLVRKRVELQGGQNRPRLRDQEVQPLDYIEHIITGFTALYRLLVRDKGELLATWLPRFALDEIRFVARATRTYGLLLQESFHPNLLRDALKRERFFDHLWVDVEFRPALARLIPAERADLLQGDIPLFTSHPCSRDLWTSRGERLPAFFEESSLELVSKRLRQLDETNLSRQVWMIRASFTSMAGNGAPATRVANDDLRRPSEHAAPGRERFLEEARAIGDRLCASALRDGERADWLGLAFVREKGWQVMPLALDLYNGLPGVLLFLSYLGRVTGDVCYTDLAQAGLKTLRAIAQQNRAFRDQMQIGAFTGLGSSVYLFSHLAALWQERSLLGEAEELVQHLSGQIEKDEKFDLVDGAAGCIASLLSLYALAPSTQTLTAAIQCGDHLLAHAQPMQEGVGWKTKQQDIPLSGFSHGAAGIAWSLLRLAAISGEERFQHTALTVLAYERSLFCQEQRNWLDLRKRPAGSSPQQDQAPRCGISWSHGAPGIALGRLASLTYLDNATMRLELEIALETTIAHGPGYTHEQIGPNHSLAHGDCGNLETLLVAAQTLRTPYLQQHLAQLAAQLLASVRLQGWIMGVPHNVENPGLMTGLAGIGYQCLRLAGPEQVPSVLSLAPPVATCF